jgi:hypothetical protein
LPEDIVTDSDDIAADDSAPRSEPDGPTQDSADKSGSAGHAEVLDPNVIDPEQAFGPQETDEAAAASLRRDAAQHRPRSTSPPSRPRPDRRLASDESLELDTSHEIASEVEYQSEGARGMSRLEKLGLEQMLERGARRGGRLKWVVVILVVAVAVGGGFFWVTKAPEDYQPGALLETYLIFPVTDWMAGDLDRYSSEGIFAAIEGTGWETWEPEGVIDTPEQREVRQTFANDGSLVRVSVHHTDSRARVREILEQVELPARAMMFDKKAVVIRPEAGADEDLVDGLVLVLERYREMVEEEDGS